MTLPPEGKAVALVVCSALATWAALPPLTRLALRWGFVDRPAHRKIHRAPTPYLGGLAIAWGVTCGLLLAFWLNVPGSWLGWSSILVAAGAALGILLVGLFDDRFGIQIRYKLLAQFALATAFALWAYRFEWFQLPGLPPTPMGLFSVPFTVLWMLTLVNGLNFVDGVDGLAPTVASLSFLVLGLTALWLQDGATLVLCLAGLGATAAFIRYNWQPARIYLGDAGSLALGMLLAAASVSVGVAEWPRSASAAAPAMDVLPYRILRLSAVSFYPFLEISLSVARRLLQGKSIGSADKGHIHHRLLARGWSAPMICLTVALLSVLMDAVTACSMMQMRGVAVYFLVAAVLLLGIGLYHCGYLSGLRPNAILQERPHFLIANHFISMQRIKLGLALSCPEVIELINQTCIEFGVHDYSLLIRGEAEAEPALKMEWKHPPLAHAAHVQLPAHKAERRPTLLHDSVSTPDGAARVAWTFEPPGEEADIDVEHRVLVSDFMRQAAERAVELFDTIPSPNPIPPLTRGPDVSSSSFRKRTVTFPFGGFAAPRAPAPPEPPKPTEKKA